MASLATEAERRAQRAQELPAFRALALGHIKEQVALILSLIGREGIFDEYTRHDISHVDQMLHALDWLLPETAREQMTPADWLLIVLAIYFHDIGMLVTRKEFEHRDSSGFAAFCDEALFSGDDAADYRAKIDELDTEDRDRFLYQEYVRHNHAKRGRMWILGKAPAALGVTHDSMRAVSELLEKLPPVFLSDLATVCESHHLSDLDDFAKYPTDRPYGNSSAETANVQWAALVLRLSDLLHVTSDRTPPIMFRIINPTDPISQAEWAKQKAVRTIRPQLGRDREGNPSSEAPQDTLEIHAEFEDPLGFFALSAYLAYVEKELRRCHQWASMARRLRAVPFELQWAYIDSTHVQASGFLPRQFEFTVDQAKILDLLTGHTLYDNWTVVLRELIQNSFDAIRLQQVDDQRGSEEVTLGSVRVNWRAENRELRVTDNGTGISQRAIQDHLLKVGASRYQDDTFRRQYPEFSAISRFGIGVLSAFMIASEVDVFTISPEDEEARHLALRQLHGKYLIRLMDKQDRAVAHLGRHGTEFRLKVRANVSLESLVDVVRRWVVVPPCEVLASVNDEPAVSVGYGSPKAALEAFIQAGEGYSRQMRVVEVERPDVTVAFLCAWSPYFREWEFVRVTGRMDAATGTCVEGIRIDPRTPGYSGYGIVALANAHGANAPKTNVARSSLEPSGQLDAMVRSIYDVYCGHVQTEIDELVQERGLSLTWAVKEGAFLLRPLLPERTYATREDAAPVNRELLKQSVERVTTLIAEQNGIRNAVSPAAAQSELVLWTLESEFFEHAESLIREVPRTVSLSTLARATFGDIELPEEPILIAPQRIGDSAALADREVERVVIRPDERRVDLRWVKISDPPRWQTLMIPAASVASRLSPRLLKSSVHVATPAVTINGGDEVGVRSAYGEYFFRNTPIAEFLREFIETVDYSDPVYGELARLISETVRHASLRVGGTTTEFRRRQARHYMERGLDVNPAIFEHPVTQNLYEALSETDRDLFYPLAWKRDLRAEWF